MATEIFNARQSASNKNRYIIRVVDWRGQTGYISFEWKNGKRYAECFGVNNIAHTMTENQMGYFCDILNGNDVKFEIIQIL